VLSTTRHLSQGGVCLMDEKWDHVLWIVFHFMRESMFELSRQMVGRPGRGNAVPTE
jgi:hypothetical protein